MRVLFLIFDAFDPYRLSPRLTPNLWRLANADGAATGVGISVMASCTYPNHASFATGLGPDDHGIFVNHVIEDGRVLGAWEKGLSVPTVFEHLSHLETAAVLGDHHLVGVMGAEKASRHWPPGGDSRLAGRLDSLGYPDDSEVITRLIEEVGSQAQFVVGYFGSIDTISHLFGPASAEATEAYAALDSKVGDLAGHLREDTVVVAVSDHVQDEVAGPGIDIRSSLEIDDLLVIDEGSASLVSGLDDASRLGSVSGVEGWRTHRDGTVLAWCEPGRYFGPFDEPVFLGVHGGQHTRRQLAMVSGPHAAGKPLADTVRAGPVPATYWASAVIQLFDEART